MGDIIKRGTKDKPRFYMRWVDGYRPAVETDGTPKLWESGPRKGQPKVDAHGKPLNEPIRRMKVAKGARNVSEARTMLAGVERRISNGLVGVEERTPEDHAKKAITIDQLAARFLGDVEGEPGYASPKIKNLANYRRNARTSFKSRIRPRFGTSAAASITTTDIERWRDDLLTRDIAEASVKQSMAHLSKLFAWSRKVGLIECHSPVQGVERPDPAQSLDYLDGVEVSRLLSHARAASAIGATWQTRMLWPMASTAIYCGLRKGELFGLRWRDVDLAAARIDVMRSYELLPKSGKPRHVPMHADLVPILKAWKKQCPGTPDGLVFPVDSGAGQFRMGVSGETLELGAMLVRAKCHEPTDGKPWHMLRHTFASHAMMSGTSLYGLQLLLGHSTPTMTQRYSHLSPSHLAGEVARLRFAPLEAAAPPAVEP